MDRSLAELLDFSRLQGLLDRLHAASGISTAIVGNDGTIHVRSGWTDLCRNFHRAHPRSADDCAASDRCIVARAREEGADVILRCPHGLAKAAVPIFVDGEAVGSLFTGQVHPVDPDLEAFRRQAQRYAYDEGAYLEAVRRVPVVPDARLREHLGFLTEFAAMLVELGVKRFRERDAERAVRESEERFRTLIEHATDVTTVLNGDATFRYQSPSLERLLGHRPEELVGKSAFEFIHPADHPAIRSVMGDVFRVPGEPHAAAYRFLHRDGSWRHLESVGKALAEPDGGICVIVNSRDITDRVTAEEALRRSEERYRSLYQSAPAMLLSIDREGRLLSVSDRWQEVLGYGAGEVLGRDATELLTAESARFAAEETLPAIRRTGACKDVPLQFVKRDGGVIDVLLSATSERDSQGGSLRFMAVLEDVTGRKQAEAEKERLQAELQQAMKMEAVGRLAGGVAHDFNNLLTAIIGNIALANMKLPPASPVSGMLKEATRAAERAAVLTQQLLAFSRKQIIEPKVVNLNDLIDGLRTMLDRLIGEHIDLQTAPAHDLGAARIDPGQFEQILVNLVVNARDAMPGGGKIVIATSNVAAGAGRGRRHPQAPAGRYVCLSVGDTGYGMSEEVKSRVFEPFFTTKAKGIGTGLGLATIDGIVNQAGGTIHVRSEIGKGSTFEILLPRVEAPARESEAAGPRPGMPRGRGTVLVVEDEDAVREICVTVLSGLGYEVLHAPDGFRALSAAGERGGRIDLLLTDVVMPGMNGRELARRLLEIHPETRVLYTSGYTDDAIVVHGVLEEGVSFLGKPYSPSVLAEKVREVLRTAP